MKWKLRTAALAAASVMLLGALGGCGSSESDGRQIIRIGHNQSTNHPTHIALVAFEEFIESKLGDKYDVEVFPSELLGSQNEMVQLTQTGAINFCVASNSLLETFSDNYTLFNLPYLFASSEAYHAAMDDESHHRADFRPPPSRPVLRPSPGWTPVPATSTPSTPPSTAPADLKGLKIRVQQSPTNVQMMNLLGGSATPMGFGDVYTALQSKIIDGAENNELALTDNGHGDVCKYYSYDMHQMIPDILIGNVAFLDGLSDEERAIFEEGFQLVNQVQREEWTTAVEAAKDRAANEQGVQFLYPDTKPFQEACAPMHEEMLQKYPDLQPIYDAIQAYNAQYPSTES